MTKKNQMISLSSCILFLIMIIGLECNGQYVRSLPDFTADIEHIQDYDSIYFEHANKSKASRGTIYITDNEVEIQTFENRRRYSVVHLGKMDRGGEKAWIIRKDEVDQVVTVYQYRDKDGIFRNCVGVGEAITNGNGIYNIITWGLQYYHR